MSKKTRLEVLISIRPLPVWIMVSQWPAFQNNKIHSLWPQPEIINVIKKYKEETLKIYFSPKIKNTSKYHKSCYIEIFFHQTPNFIDLAF